VWRGGPNRHAAKRSPMAAARQLLLRIQTASPARINRAGPGRQRVLHDKQGRAARWLYCSRGGHALGACLGNGVPVPIRAHTHSTYAACLHTRVHTTPHHTSTSTSTTHTPVRNIRRHTLIADKRASGTWRLLHLGTHPCRRGRGQRCMLQTTTCARPLASKASAAASHRQRLPAHRHTMRRILLPPPRHNQVAAHFDTHGSAVVRAVPAADHRLHSSGIRDHNAQGLHAHAVAEAATCHAAPSFDTTRCTHTHTHTHTQVASHERVPTGVTTHQTKPAAFQQRMRCFSLKEATCSTRRAHTTLRQLLGSSCATTARHTTSAPRRQLAMALQRSAARRALRCGLVHTTQATLMVLGHQSATDGDAVKAATRLTNSCKHCSSRCCNNMRNTSAAVARCCLRHHPSAHLKSQGQHATESTPKGACV
jgi:hypothetical protein